MRPTTKLPLPLFILDPMYGVTFFIGIANCWDAKKSRSIMRRRKKIPSFYASPTDQWNNGLNRYVIQTLEESGRINGNKLNMSNKENYGGINSASPIVLFNIIISR